MQAVFSWKCQRAAISPLLLPDSYYPHGCFSCPSSGGGPGACHKGSVNLSLNASTFPEGHAPPRCLKAHSGPPVGCLRLPHTRKRFSCFVSCFPACACLTKQCWVSAVHPLSLPPGSWPGDPGRPSPLKPPRNITSSVSTIALSPCSSGSKQPQRLRRTPTFEAASLIVGVCSLIFPSRGSCWSKTPFTQEI